MPTQDTGLAALINRLRQFLKAKEPVTSARIRERIDEIDAQLATRPTERESIERAWTDSLLDATVQDQIAHREKLDTFDLDTAKGIAVRAAFARRLEEVIAQEAHDDVTARIARARELAGGALEDVRQLDKMAKALAKAYAATLARQREFTSIVDQLKQTQMARLELELFPHIRDVPGRWRYDGLLTHHTDFKLTTVEDDQIVWPIENHGVVVATPNSLAVQRSAVPRSRAPVSPAAAADTAANVAPVSTAAARMSVSPHRLGGMF